jgi:NAD(P)-dependent dehydrogenase (short-subunit alcohol dehydrogenase family)
MPRFARIDVLVNNAASFYAGDFEELTSEQIDRQLAVSLIGPMNVARAVLPVMRRQRSGHIISISSSAGLAAGSTSFPRPRLKVESYEDGRQRTVTSVSRRLMRSCGVAACATTVL